MAILESEIQSQILLQPHLYYQLGEITGYLERIPFGSNDELAIILRGVKGGSMSSFTGRIDQKTNQLKQDYNSKKEYNKSQIIQNFISTINSRSPGFYCLRENNYVTVYRAINLSDERLKLMTPLEQFPHPLPFSASWAIDLSQQGWADTNTVLEIQLPLNYQFLTLSCPYFITFCHAGTDVLQEFFGRKIMNFLNQEQQELLIMPSNFKILNVRELATSEPRSKLIVTVRPIRMEEERQKELLRVPPPDPPITW